MLLYALAFLVPFFFGGLLPLKRCPLLLLTEGMCLKQLRQFCIERGGILFGRRRVGLQVLPTHRQSGYSGIGDFLNVGGRFRMSTSYQCCKATQCKKIRESKFHLTLPLSVGSPTWVEPLITIPVYPLFRYNVSNMITPLHNGRQTT